MEYINIISKEPITAAPSWMAMLGAIICIGSVASTFIYWGIVHNPDKVVKYLSIVGCCAVTVCLIWCIVLSIFFQEPTGRYKYEATIDKDKITVSEYEEFIEEYNPTIKDGIYYWEDQTE